MLNLLKSSKLRPLKKVTVLGLEFHISISITPQVHQRSDSQLMQPLDNYRPMVLMLTKMSSTSPLTPLEQSLLNLMSKRTQPSSLDKFSWLVVFSEITESTTTRPVTPRLTIQFQLSKSLEQETVFTESLELLKVTSTR